MKLLVIHLFYHIMQYMQLINDCQVLLPDITHIPVEIVDGLIITLLVPPQQSNLSLGIKAFNASQQPSGIPYEYFTYFGRSWSVWSSFKFVCNGSKWIQMG